MRVTTTIEVQCGDEYVEVALEVDAFISVESITPAEGGGAHKEPVPEECAFTALAEHPILVGGVEVLPAGAELHLDKDEVRAVRRALMEGE